MPPYRKRRRNARPKTVQNKFCITKALIYMKLDFIAMQKRCVETVQNALFLHQKSPIDLKGPHGYTYRLHPTKGLRVLIGDSEYCVPGSSVYDMLNSQRKKAKALIALLLIPLALIATGAVLILSHPASGEMMGNALMSGLLLLISVCFAGFGAYMAYNIWRSCRTVFAEEVQRWAAQKELPAQAASALDISPDILVVQRPGEDSAAYACRVEEAVSESGHGVWVLAMAQGEPAGQIWMSPTKAATFFRNDPPFQSAEWTDDQRIVPLNYTPVGESNAEFMQYVNDFVYYYRMWAPIRKAADVEQNDGGRTWIGHIRAKSAAVLIVLAMACTGLFAQAAAQVEQAIGTGIRNVPLMGADISYQFQKKTLGRIGNGKSNIVELLTAIPAYRDCCYGPLVAVYVDGDLVAKGNATGDVAQNTTTAQAMRPQGSAIPPERVKGFQMPDSAGMVTMAERAKRQIDEIGLVAGQSIRPWWEVVMHTLWIAFPFLIIAGAVCWLVAGVCAREGIYDLHKYARRGLAIIALSVAGILLVNFLLIAVSMGMGPLGLPIVAIIETLIAYKLVTWLVPDFTPAYGNEPERDPRRRFPQIGP